MTTNKNKQLQSLLERYKKNKSSKLEAKIFQLTCNLVEIIVRKYDGRGVPLDDLLQVGNLGLLKAIRRFDLEKGVQFNTFASPTIEGEIKRYFRDRGWDINIPRRLKELQPKIDAAFEFLSHSLGYYPSEPEIAEHIQVPVQDVREALQAKNLYHSISMDTPLNDDEDIDSMHNILGEEDPDLSEFATRNSILGALDNLSRKERLLIYYRYYQCLPQKILAEKFNVSQMQISRWEHKALRKLKKPLVSLR